MNLESLIDVFDEPLPAGFQIVYPESDGMPMGETDVHRAWMAWITSVLTQRYAGQRAYITSNLLLYVEEDNPMRYVVPDVFLVKAHDSHDRRVYKLWEEGKPPNVVFEVTSKKTRAQDRRDKPAIYEQIGVAEYFLYDPTAGYLKPALQGMRLGPKGYVRLKADREGNLFSEQLDALLRLDGTELLMIDRASKQVLLDETDTALEVARAALRAAEAERREKEAERAARLSVEAELERLRALAKKHGLE